MITQYAINTHRIALVEGRPWPQWNSHLLQENGRNPITGEFDFPVALRKRIALNPDDLNECFFGEESDKDAARQGQNQLPPAFRSAGNHV